MINYYEDILYLNNKKSIVSMHSIYMKRLIQIIEKIFKLYIIF